MIKIVYSKAFKMLAKKPFRLWGLSLLNMLLCTLACIFGVLPLISIPICLVLEAGMAKIYLDSYRGAETVNSEQLFAGFKKFFRFAWGMAWMYLWVLIWFLIPVAGIVLGTMKYYSYRFVPYILMENPDISATEALRLSMKKTEGHKGAMFGGDILAVGIVFAASFVLGALGAIPYLGVIFKIVGGIFVILVSVLSPLFYGLLGAGYYEEAGNMEKAEKDCPVCGKKIDAKAGFCPFCGTKLIDDTPKSE